MSEQPGSIADEAARLLSEVQQRVLRGVADAAGRRSTGGGSHGSDDVWARATADPLSEQDASPVARFKAFSRAAAPRVAGHLAEAGGALFAAAKDLLDAYERTRPQPHRPATAERTDGTRGSDGASGVQHIRVD